MKKLSLFTFFLSLTSILLMAENNNTKNIDTNKTNVESNQSVETNSTKDAELKKQVEEQMKREEKYAKEQIFYQGDDYDLSPSEVNTKSLEKLKLIEPDFDFDMDDVYRDDM